MIEHFNKIDRKTLTDNLNVHKIWQLVIDYLKDVSNIWKEKYSRLQQTASLRKQYKDPLLYIYIYRGSFGYAKTVWSGLSHMSSLTLLNKSAKESRSLKLENLENNESGLLNGWFSSTFQS